MRLWQSRGGAQWLVVVLTLFISLGHACELPAAATFLHVHGAAHETSHDHSPKPAEAEIDCDAVAGIRTICAGIDDRDGSHTVPAALPIGHVVRTGEPLDVARAEPASRFRRPLPLFLLHASLLI
jgi:hypothetical protein